MTPPRIRPPLGADERTQLVSWLDLQRAIAAWKCEGLSEEDAHRSHERHPRASRRPEGLLLTGVAAAAPIANRVTPPRAGSAATYRAPRSVAGVSCGSSVTNRMSSPARADSSAA